MTAPQFLSSALERLSRRDFLRLLAVLVGGSTLVPALQIRAGGRVLDIPPTLMLHSKDRWKLEAILKWLSDNGYTGLTYRDFARVIRGEATLPTRPVILTIDDVGTHYVQPYYVAMIDLVEKAGFRGVIGVVTRATPKEKPGNYRTLAELAARGWELDTHTTNHPVLPSLRKEADLRVEIVDSAKMLQDGLNATPTSLIVPYANLTKTDGQVDRRIFEVSAQAGLEFVVGMTQGRQVEAGQPPYYLGRVGVGKDAAQTARWLMNFKSKNEEPGSGSRE